MKKLIDSKLGIIPHSPAVKKAHSLMVNNKIGILVDNISGYFKEIVFICAVTDNKNFFSENGRPIYDYEIKSRNVKKIEIALTGRQSPVKMVINALKRISIYTDAIKKSDYVYIFMPGFSHFLAIIMCMLKRKKYFLYFASDWYETARFRANWRGFYNIFYFLYIVFIKYAEKFVVKYASFTLVTGKSYIERLKKYNNLIFETRPMMLIKQEDIFVKNQAMLKDKINLLFVGSVSERKGLIYLLLSFDHLYKFGIDVSNIILSIVGPRDEEYWQKVKNVIVDKNYFNNVHYIGYITNKNALLSIYRKSDILVLPSLAEGFPRVIYEAMSQSLPVIASRINTIYRTLGDRKLVLYCNPRDPESIAECIADLVNNVALRAELIDNSLKFVNSKIGPDCSSQIVGLINSHMLST